MVTDGVTEYISVETVTFLAGRTHDGEDNEAVEESLHCTRKRASCAGSL